LVGAFGHYATGFCIAYSLLTLGVWCIKVAWLTFQWFYFTGETVYCAQ
jgi:hypothetical protein